MQVLVADDDPTYRLLLQTMLSRWGYDVVVANDGTSAWAILERDDSPELVILDWVMPGFDGEELCRLVRNRPSERYTFLLLLTAKKDRTDLVHGLEAGADDYLSKPFDPEELRARLNTGRRILQAQNDLIAAREAMRRQATRDALTGTWNHAAILEVLDRELGRSRREGRPVGIILADLDHFKQVNDTHGHLAGDSTLREVTARIAAAMRPYDLVGRYGGEEFLLILPGCDEASTIKVCERIRERIAEQQVSHDDRQIPVTLSLGATVYTPPSSVPALALLNTADRALYNAKAAGRNRVEFLAQP